MECPPAGRQCVAEVAGSISFQAPVPAAHSQCGCLQQHTWVGRHDSLCHYPLEKVFPIFLVGKWCPCTIPWRLSPQEWQAEHHFPDRDAGTCNPNLVLNRNRCSTVAWNARHLCLITCYIFPPGESKEEATALTTFPVCGLQSRLCPAIPARVC